LIHEPPHGFPFEQLLASAGVKKKNTVSKPMIKRFITSPESEKEVTCCVGVYLMVVDYLTKGAEISHFQK
jgi:hypothetical protein